MDVDRTDHPIEAGAGFAVKRDKPGGFMGQNASAGFKDAGVPERRMLLFQLNDPGPSMWGNEIIYLNGVPVGCFLVGAYGHTLGGTEGIGFA